MGWQVALTEEADADLGNVVAFLAKKSPAAAERIGLELVALIFSLDQLANRGAPVRKRPGLRKIAASRLNAAKPQPKWHGSPDPWNRLRNAPTGRETRATSEPSNGLSLPKRPQPNGPTKADWTERQAPPPTASLSTSPWG